MSQEIERDHAISPLRKGARERLVHAPAQQQSVDEHHGPIAGSVLGIRQTLTVMRECRHELSG
jgi:hypothetical protein